MGSTGLGEENNTAPDGNDKNLMTGYLDTSNTSVTTVTVEGLGEEFTSSGYKVVAYAVGGEPTGQGVYSIGDQGNTITFTEPFDGRRDRFDWRTGRVTDRAPRRLSLRSKG